MTLVNKNDIKIFIDIPRPDGSVEQISLQEMDSAQYVSEIARISKNVAISDTSDLIFRIFAKSKNKEADLDTLSQRIPCLNQKYLPGLKQLFSTPQMDDFIDAYNSSSDKYEKRAIRKQIMDILNGYVEQNIELNDLQFNFSKFKYDEINNDKSKIIRNGLEKIQAMSLGLDQKDNFVMASYRIWTENISRRAEQDRKAYWLLIKDSNNKVIGMTFISSKQLVDKRINENIIGHSGQILDPSVQGRGYVSAIKSVMVDFMYDNIPDDVAQNSLFATTCDEFNENSQGLQIKSGAKPLLNKDGNVAIDGGKMHWYATKDSIMNSEIMRQCVERGIKYTVNHNGDSRLVDYMKILGKPEHIQISKDFTKGFDYDR